MSDRLTANLALRTSTRNWNARKVAVRRLTLELSLRGEETALKARAIDASPSGRNSPPHFTLTGTGSLAGAGAWREPPMLVSDGEARVAVFIEAAGVLTVLHDGDKLQVEEIGGMDIDDFHGRFNPGNGFVPVPWDGERTHAPRVDLTFSALD